MTDRDLTPAEARAEVEAFMGEGWTVDVHGFVLEVNIEAKRGNVVVFSGWHRSPRAAVAALKQAWRDAVRPWVVKAGNAWDEVMTDEWNAREVLGEDK